MLMPRIFGENLFDDFFDNFSLPALKAVRFYTPAYYIYIT